MTLYFSGSGCKYYLSLSDDGNIRVNATNCTIQNIPSIVWQLYLDTSIQKTQQIYYHMVLYKINHGYLLKAEFWVQVLQVLH